MCRGKRREAIAELLKGGVSKLEQINNPWLLHVLHGSVENSECVVFVSERVIGTLSTILSSQHGGKDFGNSGNYFQSEAHFLRQVLAAEATVWSTAVTTLSLTSSSDGDSLRCDSV